MSARDDYPFHAALEALNAGALSASALDEIDRLRAELAAAEGPLPPWPITAAIDNRDLLDVIAWDDDVPVFRRNEARQAVADFDRALRGDDAQLTFWQPSNRADPRAAAIADRHYNRQKIGAPQFVPPGRCMVLRHDDDALWVTSWPFAEYVQHAWPGAWMNSCFRKEGVELKPSYWQTATNNLEAAAAEMSIPQLFDVPA